MARYRVILAYDGTDFYGFQRQASDPNKRTVQGVVETALRQAGWQGRSILGAGRTDTGVHASGQVIAFDLDWAHSPQALQAALNSRLPPDVAVQAAYPVAPDFHPRYDALARRYRYCLFCQPERDPLRERYAWRVWPPVADLTPLAKIWLGAHDFAAFGSPAKPGGSTLRTVLFAEWQDHRDEWIFEIQADAFLYRMVRRLVYVQVAAGQGRVQAEALAQALQGRTRESSRGVSRGIQDVPMGAAPASGLTLVEVRYDSLV